MPALGVPAGPKRLQPRCLHEARHRHHAKGGDVLLIDFGQVALRAGERPTRCPRRTAVRVVVDLVQAIDGLDPALDPNS